MFSHFAQQHGEDGRLGLHMSFPTNEQYERIARYLDGEPISLTGQEATFARDLQDQEFALADTLPVPIESGLLPRVRRRVERAIRSSHRPVRRGLWATAAAAVVGAFMAHHWSAAPIAPTAPRTGGTLVSSLDPELARPAAPRTDVKIYEDHVAAIGMELDHDLRDLETDAVLSLTPTSPSGEASDKRPVPADDSIRS